MARFSYKALSRGGDLLTGEIAADSRDAAIAKLRAQRFVPLEVDSRGDRGDGPGAGAGLFRRRKATEKDLMLFTRELEILLSAGIPLAGALERLDGLVRQGPMRGVAGAMLRAVKSGSSLAEALETGRQVLLAAREEHPESLPDPGFEDDFEKYRWFPLPHEVAAWQRREGGR